MESRDDTFNCNICFELFDTSDKAPLILPCGHTFCKRCIKKQFRRGKIDCPLDKKTHQAPKADHFPLNFTILHSIEVAAATPKKIVKRCS